MTARMPRNIPSIAFVSLCLGGAEALAVQGPATVPAATGTECILGADVFFAGPSDEAMDAGVGLVFRSGRALARCDAALEAGRVQFDPGCPFAPSAEGIDAEAEVDLTQLTLGGRYGLDLMKGGRVQLLFGESVGADNSSIDIRVSQSGGPPGSVSANAWVLTYAAEVGVEARLTSRFRLTGGLRYQVVGEATFNIAGMEAAMEDITLSIVYGGCGVSF